MNELGERNNADLLLPRQILDMEVTIFILCQDSSVVRFLRIGPMVSGSNPPSAKLLLRVK